MENKMSETWTREDSESAVLQGWDVFQASLNGQQVPLIERCDDLAIFEDDMEALKFVKNLAANGDLLAKKALRLDYEVQVQLCVDGASGL